MAKVKKYNQNFKTVWLNYERKIATKDLKHKTPLIKQQQFFFCEILCFRALVAKIIFFPSKVFQSSVNHRVCQQQMFLRWFQ